MPREKILLVDNDPLTLESVESAFAEKGFVLYSAANGKEGIRKVARYQPDLILLEVEIPVMDGWEVCFLLKKNAGTKDIPIIFMSLEGGIHNKLQAFQFGASGFIPKPFSAQELIAEIERQLARRQKT